MADQIKATPRRKLEGLLADGIGGLNDFAAKPFGYNNPPGAMIFEMLGLPAVSRTLDRMSYGEPLTMGRGMTTRMLPDTEDSALAAAGLLGPAARITKGLPIGMGIKDVGASAARAEELLRKSPEFAKLKGQDAARAILAARAKAGEGDYINRSMGSLLGATGGEDDIARSMMTNPGYKVGGVVPTSELNKATAQRKQLRAEPPTTPGANASEAEWKAWGDKYGVNMTVTPPQSLGVSDLTTGREVMIPGGLDGKFTIPDMFWIKANNFDPNALAASGNKELHDALMQKFIRTHQIENPDQVDKFNRLNFALLSPNAPLTQNEFLAQRARLRTLDELQALGGRVNEPGLSQTAARQLGVGAANNGGMGVLGTADLGNQANLARSVLDKPGMFDIAPGETMRDVTTRTMNQVPGLGPKTASLGTPWLDLTKANTSAVDLHMIRNSYERMLNDPIVGDDFRKRMAGLLKVEPTYEAIMGAPGAEKAAIKIIGGTNNSRKYRLKDESLNRIPDVATPDKLAYEPKTFQDFNPFYNRVVDYVDESRGANPSMELFPEQWRKWDGYRQRVEPHEFAHPDFRNLPRQSFTEMQDALTAHKDAGYTQSANPVMKPTDWRKLYYGAIDPTLMGIIGAGTAGGLLGKEYLGGD